VYTATTSRAAFAMTNNRYFPRVFGRLSAAGVPYPALLLDLVVGFFFLLPFPSWSKFVGFVSSATVLTYIIGPIAVSTLRRTAPDLSRPVRIGGLQVWAPLAFIVSSLIIYWSGWSVVSVVMGAALAGLIIYFIYFDLRAATGDWTVEEITRGLWLVAYLVAIAVVSYLGTFGGRNLIRGPWDQLLVIALAIVGYYVGLHYGYATRYLDEVRGKAADLQTGRVAQGEVEDFGTVAL
jgi:amino acid transporter